jgi:DNA-binding NarL/FixJ family response regulator
MKTIGDCVVGDEDVDFFDCDDFYEQLSPNDRAIVDLRRIGLNNHEIGETLGLSHKTVCDYVSRLRYKWRNMYGN